MAERVGFEPTVPLPVHLISSHLRFTPLDVFLLHFKPDSRIPQPIDFTDFYGISFRKS